MLQVFFEKVFFSTFLIVLVFIHVVHVFVQVELTENSDTLNRTPSINFNWILITDSSFHWPMAAFTEGYTVIRIEVSYGEKLSANCITISWSRKNEQLEAVYIFFMFIYLKRQYIICVLEQNQIFSLFWSSKVSRCKRRSS